MDWCRLSTRYYFDGAILRAGEPAEVLFLRCLAYSGSEETGGRVPKHVLPLLTPSKTRARLTALLREQLLVEDGDDVVIRSWSRHQEALDAESDRRRRDRERKAAVRQAERDAARTSAEVSADCPRTVLPESARKEVEVQEKEQKTSGASLPDRFDEFWEIYPKRVGRGQAVKAWKAALRKTDADTVLAGVTAFAESVAGKDPTFIAHPSTWLNGERWTDDRSHLRVVANGSTGMTLEQQRRRL